MKTILIPLDFHITSKNVLEYVADMTRDIVPERIILLRSVHVSIVAQMIPSADFVQVNADEIEWEKDHCKKETEGIAHEFAKKIHKSVKVEIALTELPMLRAIINLIADESCDIVTIQSPGHFDGSQSTSVVEIARVSQVPVLVVPANANYYPVRRALIPIDFTAISVFNLLRSLRKIWFIRSPDLMVLNIDSSGQNNTDSAENNFALKEALESYQYKVFHSGNPDIIHGISEFTVRYEPDLVIVLPGKHSAFYRLTHQSITKGLVSNATQPVLILK